MKNVFQKVRSSLQHFNQQGFAGIRYYQILILLAVALLAIIIGSPLDLQISQSLVKPNNAFGFLFAILGPLPAYALFGGTGVLFYINWEGEGKKDSRILALICALIFPILAGSLFGYQCIADYLSNRYLAAFCGILAVGVLDVGLYFLARKADKEDAYKASITFLFAGATLIVLLYLLKKAGLRPRYLFLLLEKNTSYYRSWWEFDASVMEQFSDLDSDYFASWPSAHAGLAAMSVLSVLLCSLNPRLKGKEAYFVYGSLIWSILTCAARVSDGHHYLSDVGFGAFFGVLFPLLVVYLIYLDVPEEVSESAPVKKPIPALGRKHQANQGHLPPKHRFVKAKHNPCKKAL